MIQGKTRMALPSFDKLNNRGGDGRRSRMSTLSVTLIVIRISSTFGKLELIRKVFPNHRTRIASRPILTFKRPKSAAKKQNGKFGRSLPVDRIVLFFWWLLFR
ncbi:hypothetical protein C5Y93_29385 [Blastopirellula marina]|uniref:Uncharacterized protein n=1 Tax=Blastopirellula marina TaxID=124 RepID=A0A2S8GDA1_9BACT|nr:hypothetical protein C5Y93_29385 [Blastopirellula marina]